MNAISRRLLFWTPRVICILFALFLSMFALDVFGEGLSFGKTVLAFLIHLIPVYILLIVLAIAWRWEWVGALGFAGLATWYAQRNWAHHPDWVATIAGPVFVIAALFLVNWMKHDTLRARP